VLAIFTSRENHLLRWVQTVERNIHTSACQTIPAQQKKACDCRTKVVAAGINMCISTKLKLFWYMKNLTVPANFRENNTESNISNLPNRDLLFRNLKRSLS